MEIRKKNKQCVLIIFGKVQNFHLYYVLSMFCKLFINYYVILLTFKTAFFQSIFITVIIKPNYFSPNCPFSGKFTLINLLTICYIIMWSQNQKMIYLRRKAAKWLCIIMFSVFFLEEIHTILSVLARKIKMYPFYYGVQYTVLMYFYNLIEISYRMVYIL